MGGSQKKERGWGDTEAEDAVIFRAHTSTELRLEPATPKSVQQIAVHPLFKHGLPFFCGCGFTPSLTAFYYYSYSLSSSMFYGLDDLMIHVGCQCILYTNLLL